MMLLALASLLLPGSDKDILALAEQLEPQRLRATALAKLSVTAWNADDMKLAEAAYRGIESDDARIRCAMELAILRSPELNNSSYHRLRSAYEASSEDRQFRRRLRDAGYPIPSEAPRGDVVMVAVPREAATPFFTAWGDPPGYGASGRLVLRVIHSWEVERN